jgi:hypothetical protein
MMVLCTHHAIATALNLLLKNAAFLHERLVNQYHFRSGRATASRPDASVAVIEKR